MNHFICNRANSRETYFTLHNVKSAHAVALGKNIKVGIIDWLFAYDENPVLYAGYADISNTSALLQQTGHGFWMANTLREIAPACEIYAINAVLYGENADRIGLLEKAVTWAICNEMHILTYSHPAFEGEEKHRLHAALEKAAKAGIITTFIHCDNRYNIWPYGCFPFRQTSQFDRSPDVNILHFDYNIFRTDVYERYKVLQTLGQSPQCGDDVPFFSFSSLSPVLGGFVALLKECKKDLSADHCRKILAETSFSIAEKGRHWYDVNPCGRVVDIGHAVKTLSLSK